MGTMASPLMSVVVFPLIIGYIAKIYRGDQPAPKFEEGGLFILGLKLIFAGLIYAIPVIAVLLVTIFYAMVNFMPYIIMGNPAYIFNNMDKFVGVLLGIGYRTADYRDSCHNHLAHFDDCPDQARKRREIFRGIQFWCRHADNPFNRLGSLHCCNDYLLGHQHYFLWCHRAS